MLSLNNARADKHLTIVPRSKLTCRHASLRLIEEKVHAITLCYELCALQRLTIADTHIITTSLTLGHALRRVNPVHLLRLDTQRAAIESGMRIALAYIYHILLYVGSQNKQRLLAAADAEPLTLTYGIEVRTIMRTDLLTIAHRITERLALCSQIIPSLQAIASP